MTLHLIKSTRQSTKKSSDNLVQPESVRVRHGKRYNRESIIIIIRERRSEESER